VSSEPAHIIERAFQLAQSGRCASIDEIRRELKREQFGSIEQHLGGAHIRKQLRDLILASRP
jgi:hypothetical protein